LSAAPETVILGKLVGLLLMTLDGMLDGGFADVLVNWGGGDWREVDAGVD